jgi:hypothetical protein
MSAHEWTSRGQRPLQRGKVAESSRPVFCSYECYWKFPFVPCVLFSRVGGAMGGRPQAAHRAEGTT